MCACGYEDGAEMSTGVACNFNILRDYHLLQCTHSPLTQFVTCEEPNWQT